VERLEAAFLEAMFNPFIDDHKYLFALKFIKKGVKGVLESVKFFEDTLRHQFVFMINI